MKFSYVGKVRNLMAAWRLFALREQIVQDGKSQREIDTETVNLIRRDLAARQLK